MVTGEQIQTNSFATLMVTLSALFQHSTPHISKCWPKVLSFAFIQTHVDYTKGRSNIPLDTHNDVDLVNVRKQLDTFTEYHTIAISSGLPQNTLNDKMDFSCQKAHWKVPNKNFTINFKYSYNKLQVYCMQRREGLYHCNWRLLSKLDKEHWGSNHRTNYDRQRQNRAKIDVVIVLQ